MRPSVDLNYSAGYRIGYFDYPVSVRRRKTPVGGRAGVEQQHPIKVYYDGIVVGDYVADLLVEGCVLVELKAVKALGNIEMAQCLNYLKAIDLRICLLFNFGRPKVKVKRIVHNF